METDYLGTAAHEDDLKMFDFVYAEPLVHNSAQVQGPSARSNPSGPQTLDTLSQQLNSMQISHDSTIEADCSSMDPESADPVRFSRQADQATHTPSKRRWAPYSKQASKPHEKQTMNTLALELDKIALSRSAPAESIACKATTQQPASVEGLIIKLEKMAVALQKHGRGNGVLRLVEELRQVQGGTEQGALMAKARLVIGKVDGIRIGARKRTGEGIEALEGMVVS